MWNKRREWLIEGDVSAGKGQKKKQEKAGWGVIPRSGRRERRVGLWCVHTCTCASNLHMYHKAGMSV